MLVMTSAPADAAMAYGQSGVFERRGRRRCASLQVLPDHDFAAALAFAQRGLDAALASAREHVALAARVSSGYGTAGREVAAPNVVRAAGDGFRHRQTDASLLRRDLEPARPQQPTATR